ncbi:leucoanthocyanidin dioxygenase [Apiospora kogelbergensis]|uniref:leucoanthocyanidin dioxygenase n=1 Tax=Apiospora kogelbergensis TaxID=1337665 RepID=UPI0031309E5E
MAQACIDLAGLENADIEREQVANLVQAFGRYGVVKVKNHSFSDQQLEQLFAWSKEFFSWPEPVKESANRKRTGPFRGYAGVGLESIGVPAPDSVAMKDVKESFDCGSPKDQRYPTPWPCGHARCGEFRAFVQDFYQDCERVHGQLLTLFEQAFGLRAGDLGELCSEGNGEVRLAHYPEIPVAELRTGTTFRIAEHRDIGVLTLLFQDSNGGLETEDPDRPGHFLPVSSAHPREMLLMVGETLDRWTGQTFRSIKHRVKDPPGSQVDSILPERYAVGFFGKANGAASIAPLPSFHVAASNKGRSLGDEGETAQEFYNLAHEQTTAT